MRRSLPVCHRPTHGQNPDRKEDRVSDRRLDFLWLCLLRTSLFCPLFYPQADKNERKASDRTKTVCHNYLSNRMLWKQYSLSRNGFMTAWRALERGLHSHLLSGAKTTFEFCRTEQVIPFWRHKRRTAASACGAKRASRIIPDAETALAVTSAATAKHGAEV